jgi:hypothetical protein
MRETFNRYYNQHHNSAVFLMSALKGYNPQFSDGKLLPQIKTWPTKL